MNLSFTSPMLEIQASQIEVNKSEFQGILFPIETVSDTAPSKGSANPLYVPMEVAQIVASEINNSQGLPLDAAPDLQGHYDPGIIGVMTKAEIIDHNLVVSGHLFPFNNPQVVSMIQTAKSDLGMSINALAQGITKIIGGQEVFYINYLKPLGANILKAARATWKNTAVLKASEKTALHLENERIKESLTTSPSKLTYLNDEEFTTMSDMLMLTNLFERFNQKLDSFVQASEAEVEELKAEMSSYKQQSESLIQAQSNSISQLDEKVQSLLIERETLQAQARQKEEEAEKRRSEEDLLESLTARIAASLKEDLKTPGVRKTRPLVQASADGETQPKGEMERRLIAAEASLKTLEELGVAGPERLQCIEEINYLRSLV